MTTREALAKLKQAQRVLLATANDARAGECDEEADLALAANAGLSAVSSYLSQPEGGDVEEALDYFVEIAWDFKGDCGEDTKERIEVMESRIRFALRSAKEREAAAVERTVEKAKAIVWDGGSSPKRWKFMHEILDALDSLKEKDDA